MTGRITNKFMYGFCILFPSAVYVMTFAAVWKKIAVLPMGGYVVVFLISAFLTYSFLMGAYDIARRRKKQTADFCSLESMSSEEFKAYFGFERPKKAAGECMAVYEAGGEKRREIVKSSRIWKQMPGLKGEIYVRSHRIGNRTEYEIRTKSDLMRNVLLGSLTLAATIGWLVLFICRGI